MINTHNLKYINNHANKINVYKIKKDGEEYEIYKNDKLGEGSYSSVCLGRIINSNSETQKCQFIAVKKIIKSMLSPRGLTMLTSEIEIIKEMITHDHDNIVKCHDVIDDIDVIYIIMEYCDSGDFSSLLTGKPLKYKYVKYYFGQIVSALKYLNEKKIIHRDIKPKNILITDCGRKVKLCDFGFARHSDGIKKVMTMCGSPLYMAPEIYQQIGYGVSVDVWALGIVLYEMLFGIHPLIKLNDLKKIANSITSVDIIIPENINDMEIECLALLKQMLQRSEVNRINIEELFKNEWIISCMNTSIDENIDLLLIYEDNNLFDQNTKEQKNSCDINSVCDDSFTLQEKDLSFIFEMDN